MTAYPVVFFTGPTASGKSSLAHQFHPRVFSRFISADSRQVYSDLHIGTNRVVPKDEARLNYEMLGFVDPNSSFNTHSFCEKSMGIVRNHAQEKVAFVGGTIFYMDALINGLPKHSEIPQNVVSKLQEEHKEGLYHEQLKRLKEKDPVYYSEVDRSNPRRVLRALEVIEGLGVPFSKLRKERVSFPLIPLILSVFLPRKKLYARINDRVEKMIQNGLVEEVEGLVKKGFSLKSPGLNTIGYKEIMGYLNGAMGLEEAVERIKKNTRVYAKQQITFLKKSSSVIHLIMDNQDLSKEDKWVLELPTLDKKNVILYNAFTSFPSCAWDSPSTQEIETLIMGFYGN